MRVETLRQLQNAYETVALYFRFLHLGYFFDDLSKRINSSRLVRSIDIATPQNLTYKLNQQLIVDSLENIYNNPNKVSVFSHLTLLNALRGVTMAVVEGFEKTKINGASELQEVYQNEIFLGNQRLTDSFAGALRFVRNALSHNINDKIELTEKDYLRQKNYRVGPNNPFGPTMHFYFDYDDPNSVIRIVTSVTFVKSQQGTFPDLVINSSDIEQLTLHKL